MAIQTRWLVGMLCLLQSFICVGIFAKETASAEGNSADRAYLEPNWFDGLPVNLPEGIKSGHLVKIAIQRDLGQGVSLFVIPPYENAKHIAVNLIFVYSDNDGLKVLPEKLVLQTLPNGKVYAPSKLHHSPQVANQDGDYQEDVDLEFVVKDEKFESIKLIFPKGIAVGKREDLGINPFRFNKTVQPINNSQKQFQRSISIEDYGLLAEERLRFCDPKVVISAAEEIVNNPLALKDPLALFAPAFALFQQGKKDEGVFWFYAAQLRVRYQLVFEQGDRGQLLAIMMMTMGPLINNYAFQDASNLNRILDRVSEWDKKTYNPFREMARTEGSDKQIERVYTGFRELKTKLVSEKSALEDKARKAAPEIERAYSSKDNSLCRKGLFDSTYANQTIINEKSLVKEFVEDFVVGNQGVIQDAKEIKRVSIEPPSVNGDSGFPRRYIAALDGDSKKFFVAVDVFRSEVGAKLTLACVSQLSAEQRYSAKDVCNK